jgi:hypothetical protein
MKWLDCTNMPPEPQAGSRITPSFGSITIEGGVKNSPPSCAPCLEIGEEVFVDAPQDVAQGAAQAIRIEQPHHFFKDAAFEAPVILGQLASKRRDSRFAVPLMIARFAVHKPNGPIRGKGECL